MAWVNCGLRRLRWLRKLSKTYISSLFIVRKKERKRGNPQVMVTHKNLLRNFIKAHFPTQVALWGIWSDISISPIKRKDEDEKIFNNFSFPFFWGYWKWKIFPFPFFRGFHRELFPHDKAHISTPFHVFLLRICCVCMLQRDKQEMMKIICDVLIIKYFFSETLTLLFAALMRASI